jgi:hypothetical protein
MLQQGTISKIVKTRKVVEVKIEENVNGKITLLKAGRLIMRLINHSEMITDLPENHYARKNLGHRRHCRIGK